ncbi:MAG: hemolysin-coregulated protein [Thiotrichales bacterium]|nr:MAG: hemolysin-coregulated protein [Thiotrichales bacterium]
MAIYLDYEGIQGSVTAAGYQGMTELRHFKFGVLRKVSMKTGEMANRERSLPVFSPVYIEKRMDTATMDLFRSSVVGSQGKRATVHFVSTGNHQLIEYMAYTLENCLISDYLIYDSEFNQVPHEKMQLSYTSLLVSHTVRGANNQAVATQRYGYHLATATSL